MAKTSISVNYCIEGSSYKLDNEYPTRCDLFNTPIVQYIINNESVFPEKGYKFGKFIKKTINSDCDDDDTDEYYNVSISYEFEFGTIIDSVYPNRIEDIHDLPNLILYQ